MKVTRLQQVPQTDIERLIRAVSELTETVQELSVAVAMQRKTLRLLAKELTNDTRNQASDDTGGLDTSI